MLENFEYTFFDAPVAQKFCEQVHALGLNTEIKQEESGSGEVSFEVMIKGQISDAQAEQIEDLYGELLFGEQAAQIEGNESGAVADACGVQIQLASGEYTTVAVHPHIMNKILSVLTIEEVQKFLSQVAEDIENPKAGPICRRENLPQF
ncbi:hypothetical protein GHNINEIG_00145 [Hydrogenovibrio crunogenus]|uniref:Uncharacterized protein n=1 Tax=Hydrogenovibrio crunogenus TaxID=39765 RepID=A0A4P7NWQ2_9GAMM|nr:hypothetical protein [Hydrogenovibrio crunogenus]QBZ82121.1 hypothetical protein GHNINEIG_00145 [Hydrogenovibrio crunogenus]